MIGVPVLIAAAKRQTTFDFENSLWLIVKSSKQKDYPISPLPAVAMLL
jgi:hypothetical protein